MPQRTLMPDKAVAAAAEVAAVVKNLGNLYGYRRGYLGDNSLGGYAGPMLGTPQQNFEARGGAKPNGLNRSAVFQARASGEAVPNQLGTAAPTQLGTAAPTQLGTEVSDPTGAAAQQELLKDEVPVSSDGGGVLKQAGAEGGIPFGDENVNPADVAQAAGSIPATRIPAVPLSDDGDGDPDPSTRLNSFRPPTGAEGIPFGIPGAGGVPGPSIPGVSTPGAFSPSQASTLGLPGFPSYNIPGITPDGSARANGTGKSEVPVGGPAGGGGGGAKALSAGGISVPSLSGGGSGGGGGGSAYGGSYGGPGGGAVPSNLSTSARGSAATSLDGADLANGGARSAPRAGAGAGAPGGAGAGMPMMPPPMMPMGGGAPGGPQQQQQEEQSSSKDWLQEEDDVWGKGSDGASPTTLGRH
ncbi:hypothetical protein [Streptomyces sp. NPDC058548]|uniref:hypothetical protein n=1 Tax=unclassified Streptomyces TaxID=2593676 RepID=UPI00364AD2D2